MTPRQREMKHNQVDQFNSRCNPGSRSITGIARVKHENGDCERRAQLAQMYWGVTSWHTMRSAARPQTQTRPFRCPLVALNARRAASLISIQLCARNGVLSLSWFYISPCTLLTNRHPALRCESHIVTCAISQSAGGSRVLQLHIWGLARVTRQRQSTDFTCGSVRTSGPLLLPLCGGE